MKKTTNMLIGMKEITEYTGRNRAVVIKWIENDNFPAAKIDGRWESNTELIEEYQRHRIERVVNQENKTSVLQIEEQQFFS